MSPCINLKSSLILAALLALSSAQAAITKAEYKTAKDQIGATYKSDKAACDKLTANAKDICVQEAKGKEKVARAELEHNLSGKEADRAKIGIAKANADYAIAKERCDDKAGNDKDVCVKEAKAAEVKAKADAKADKKVAEVKKDTMDDKRDADYKVAVEKCDAAKGDAKASCVAAAKAKFAKN